jgi:hypothetical protein
MITATDRYTRLRQELATLRRAFRREADCTAALYCDWIEDCSPVSEAGWEAFVFQARRQDPWATWKLLPHGRGLLRFTGDVGRMDGFERLAETGSELLDHLAACRPEGEVVLPEAVGLEGWLHVVFDTGMDAPTARLRIRTHRWGLSDQDEAPESAELYWAGAEDARFPCHPPVHKLVHDVFTSSAAVIECWLSPGEILYLDHPLERLSLQFPTAPVASSTVVTKPPKGTKPRWNREDEHMELWFGDKLIKKYEQPAKLQEDILNAFQEARWRQRVESPVSIGTNSKKLGDAVTALNSHHVTPGILRFTRDGFGAGVCWKRVDP